jgi:predicted nucleotidyltransferase
MAATGEDGGSGTHTTTAAELVFAARSKRGISQRQLAQAAGVAQSTVSTIESGHRQPSVSMLERLLNAAGFRLETRLVNAIRPSQLLEQHRDDVAKVFAGYPVSQVWVFGSVARGDDRPDSDLDLLIELTPGASIIDIIDLDEELSAVLGCPVDVVTTTELESNDLLRRGVNRHRRPLTVAA